MESCPISDCQTQTKDLNGDLLEKAFGQGQLVEVPDYRQTWRTWWELLGAPTSNGVADNEHNKAQSEQQKQLGHDINKLNEYHDDNGIGGAECPGDWGRGSNLPQSL